MMKIFILLCFVAGALGESRQIDVSLDVCELPAKSGNCLAYFPRYYYDTTTGECKKFVYGGCGGNGNNFETLADCERICVGVQRASTEDCNRYPDSGLCDAYIPRYFYDSSTGTCMIFIYGGCGGNKNNFKTAEECVAECIE